MPRCLLLFALIALPLHAQDLPGELLTNRSFELDTNADGTPEGWSLGFREGGATIALDDTVAHSGTRSVRITAPGARAGASVGFPPGAVDASAVYLLSAWVKTEGTSASGAGTAARVTSADGQGGTLRSDYRRVEPGTHDWRRYEWLVRLHPDTVRFNLVLFHHGEGTAWWDDVSLVKVTPIQALAPADGASVADGRPTFRWQPAPGAATLELSTDPGFAAESITRYEQIGDSFTPPTPLASGRTWHWRVIILGPEGVSMTVQPGDQPESARTPSFFAGSWAERSAGLREQVADKRASLAALQALAERNGMWDRFSLLADTLAGVDAALAAEPDDPATTLAALQSKLKDLEPYLPWWQRLFTDDEALFTGLDLARPGLEAVRAAVEQKDWSAARAALLDYYRGDRGLSYYGRHDGPPAAGASGQDKRAEQLLTHQMPIHSYQTPTFDLGPAFDWHIRPHVDIEWPTQIHRCFHWSSLAGAYRNTANDAYAAEIRKQLLDFVQDNPLERWDAANKRWAWSTLNATIRIYSSWTSSWLAVRWSPEWTPDAQFVFLTALREHGRFLMANFSRPGSGNWAVAEAQGLVELGTMFPEFTEAAAWRAEGFRRLAAEIDSQVLADGMHVERTPGYHGMTLGCFEQPLQLALMNGMEVAGLDHFVAKLEAMHELYLYGSKPNRRMAQIGDGGPMSVDGYLRKGWETYRREDMRWVLTGGAEGRPPVHRSYAFGAGGQYVSRSTWNDPNALWSLVDWGGFQGHCHEDMGHLELYAYGADLLVDTGRYSYDRELRRPFYETVGHNTVMVDGKTQKRRDPLEAHWVSTDAFDLFRGVTNNSEPLLHERTVAFRQPDSAGPGHWLVVDLLTGEGTHRLDQRWHATEKLTGAVAGANVVFTPKEGATGQPSITLAQLPQEALKPAIADGAISYEWYKQVPTQVAQFTYEGAMPATLATVLCPVPPDAPPAQVTVERLPGEAVTALRVTIEDRGRRFVDTWMVNPEGKAVSAGGIETDAKLAFVRGQGLDGPWFAAEGSRLSLGGQVAFTAAEPVGGLAVSADGKLSCTGATQLTVRQGGELRQLGDVPAPAVPPAPKADGPVRFVPEPPPPPVTATTSLPVQPALAAPPHGAVVMEAEAFSGQGGGRVEVSDAKAGAQGRSFLHWDSAGHWLEWRAPVPAGHYRLLLRACTAEPRVVRKLTVNGSTPPGCQVMEIAGTGGYSGERDDWRTFLVAGPDGRPIVLDLSAGEAAVRLENIDGKSLNLDWLALVGH